MNNTDFQDKMKSITDKIGEENAALILDEIGILTTDNLNMNNEAAAKDKEIAELKARNSKLLDVNANLLQQVPMAKESDLKPKVKEETKKEHYDFRTAFDQYGNFKK